MNLKTIVIGILALGVFAPPAAQTVAWSDLYNGPQNKDDKAVAIAYDRRGNVYVTGSAYYNSAFSTDFVTVKYDRFGNRVWERNYDGTGAGFDVPTAIAVDLDGNVYVTGYSEGTAMARRDFATIKYDTNGFTVWPNSGGGPDYQFHNGAVRTTFVDNEDPADLAVDANGNVYVTGRSYVLEFDGVALTVRYNANGHLSWYDLYSTPAKEFDAGKALVLSSSFVYVANEVRTNVAGGDFGVLRYPLGGADDPVTALYIRDGDDSPVDIALDSQNNVYVAGTFTDDDHLANYACVSYLPSLGVPRWAQEYDGPVSGFDRASSMAVSCEWDGTTYRDYILLTGYSQGTSDATDNDYATIKLDSLTGVFSATWGNGVRRYDGPGLRDEARKVFALGDGSIYVTGLSSETFAPWSDIATVRYDRDGDQKWVARFGAANARDEGMDLVVPCAGDVTLTGYSDVAGFMTDYRSLKYAPPEKFVGAPSSYTRENGVILSGGLEQLFNSDDDRLVIESRPPIFPGGPWISLYVQGVSGYGGNPSEICFSVESQVTTVGVMQKIDIWDWQVGAWAEMDSRVATTADSFVFINLPCSPTPRFVQTGTGSVKLRVRYYVGPAGGFEAKIDVMGWEALPPSSQ